MGEAVDVEGGRGGGDVGLFTHEGVYVSSTEFFTESFFFAVNYFLYSRRRELFAESPSLGSHQSLLLSAKALFPVVIYAVMDVFRVYVFFRKY
jgi:hypothetical protein